MSGTKCCAVHEWPLQGGCTAEMDHLAKSRIGPFPQSLEEWKCILKTGDRAVHARPPCSLSGVSGRYFATIQPLLQPVQHLILNPTHPVGAELYPQWELPDLFEACDCGEYKTNSLS